MPEPAPAIDTLDDLLAKMWSDYIALNPQAKRIHDLFTSRGEGVVNDHIALRTYDCPKVGLEVLVRPFLANGYEEKGRYRFPEKKLVARHYEPPRPELPKIFVSELVLEELGAEAQEILRGLVDQVDPRLPGRFDFCSLGRPWRVTYAAYERLRAESEYAAWVAAFGFRPNHFTVDVGSLRTLPSLTAVDDFLRAQGFALNSSGGEIKGSPAELLEQSSVLANTIAVPFEDGTYRIPACYYEFARRYPLPDGRLYQGFIAASADKIFESTDQSR
jgi:hypothetical protein